MQNPDAPQPVTPGTIYLVPTPIGHRDDITLHAIDVLRHVDRIACEDTRHSAPLLQHHGIHKPLLSLHEHNEQRRIPEVIAMLQAGESLAVITDAGMPGISDPGYRLIQQCIKDQIPYSILPGPSAILNALIGSGFPCHAFTFAGFLPIKKGRRTQVLLDAAAAAITHIFFESPHRLLSTLEILHLQVPDTYCCVARELTKKFETFHRDTATALFQWFTAHPPKGEIVFLIHPKT